jgi:hypothetical protein
MGLNGLTIAFFWLKEESAYKLLLRHRLFTYFWSSGWGKKEKGVGRRLIGATPSYTLSTSYLNDENER